MSFQSVLARLKLTDISLSHRAQGMRYTRDRFSHKESPELTPVTQREAHCRLVCTE